MRRPGHAAEIAISAAMVASTGLFAQTSDRPTVTVMAFENSTRTRLDGGALADQLASGLIDANRVRVLPRQWLQVPKGARSLDTYRTSAASAGVQFLITGKISCVRPRRVLSAISRAPSSSLVLDIRVIATDSGDVVRTQSLRVDPPVIRGMPAPPRPNGFLTIAPPVNVIPRTPAGWEAAALKREVASLAQNLDLSNLVKR